MSDEQILQKTNFKDGPRTAAMKGFIIEQKFVDFVKNTKKTYIVKNNIMIGTHEYDVVAFANKTFEKDFVYEVKYLRNNISLHQIERYREQLKKLRTNFSEELNRLPSGVEWFLVEGKLRIFTMEEELNFGGAFEGGIRFV